MQKKKNDVVGRLPKMKRIIACALGIAVLTLTQTTSNFTAGVTESEGTDVKNVGYAVTQEENLRYLAKVSEQFTHFHKEMSESEQIVSTSISYTTTSTTTTSTTTTTVSTTTNTTTSENSTTSSTTLTTSDSIQTVTTVPSTTVCVSIEENLTETYEDEYIEYEVEEYEVSYEEYDEYEEITENVYSSPEVYYEEQTVPFNSYSYAVTDSDYILLCNCVAHEAGSSWISESEKAMVAEVVLNRVNSTLYPSTIYGVVTQSGQFSGCWGYANLGYFSGEVSQSVKNAVSNYLNGSYNNHGFTSFWGDGSSNHFS